MKKFAFLLVLASLSLSAVAAPKKTTITCPVQHEKVNIASALKHHMYADYKGRRYFFCCEGCPEAFKANPAKYAKGGESLPTPKVKRS
jgi:YHS domain-containing protein